MMEQRSKIQSLIDDTRWESAMGCPALNMADELSFLYLRSSQLSIFVLIWEPCSETRLWRYIQKKRKKKIVNKKIVPNVSHASVAMGKESDSCSFFFKESTLINIWWLSFENLWDKVEKKTVDNLQVFMKVFLKNGKFLLYRELLEECFLLT